MGDNIIGQFRVEYIGEKSGECFTPPKDATIFQYVVLFSGRRFNINIMVSNIEIAEAYGNKNEFIKFGYEKIWDMILENKLESAIYDKIGDTLEKRGVKK